MASRIPDLVSPDRVDVCESLSDQEEALVREIVSRVADRWSLWVLTELAEHGALRFSRLLERVRGISQKSLTATLRQLERDGLVTRTVTAQVPIRVDYEATELGLELIRHIDPFCTWAARNHARFAAAREAYDAS